MILDFESRVKPSISLLLLQKQKSKYTVATSVKWEVIILPSNQLVSALHKTTSAVLISSTKPVKRYHDTAKRLIFMAAIAALWKVGIETDVRFIHMKILFKYNTTLQE